MRVDEIIRPQTGTLREARNAETSSDGGKIWYHGTSAEFDTFAAQPDSHLGFHFGTLQQAQRKGGRIIQARLSYSKALRTVDAGDWSNAYQAWDTINKALRGPKDWYLTDSLMQQIIRNDLSRQQKLVLIRQRVEKAGYDAIIYKNRIEGTGDSIIVFSPTQIHIQRASADQ